MIFDKRPPSSLPTYTINNTQIPICTTIKNLGVTVSNDLSWNSHILHVTSAALRLVRQLHRAIPSPSIAMIKQLYVTLIRPKIEYAQPAISPSVTALSQLERLQRKCTKWGVLRHMSYTKRL